MARTRLKPNIIRIGSQVKIVYPITVARWGYNLTKQIVKDTLITDEQKEAIHTMMAAFGSRPPAPISMTFGLETKTAGKDKVYERILDLMAWKVLQREGFGGDERKLFRLGKESLRGKIGNGVDRKVVKTGKYFASWSGYDSYSGEYDYEPGGLADEKTHVLFKVCVFTDQEGVCPNINTEDGGVWIEKENLELPVIERYYR
jgi:hypothetical protein